MIDSIKIPERYARGFLLIDLDRIHNNLDNMYKTLKPGTKMIGVIKTDGYGHGSIPIAKMLENMDYMWGYAVATPEEAEELRKAGMKKPMLILGYSYPYCYEMLANDEIRPAVFKKDMADALEEAAVRAGKNIKIHIKVDTGMNRIGIKPDDEGLEVVKYLLTKKHLEIEGIFTHFAKADEENLTAAEEQFKVFSNFTERIHKELGLAIPLKHCSNSAGILTMHKANMDIVRAGITLYGLSPSEEVDITVCDLQPALSWYSSIAYIKTIPEGSAISYGGTFVAEHEMRIATIPMGYGDGYPRSLSNQGYVLIAGKKAPILGRVCMDQFMVDVSAIPAATEGMRVVLIGKDGDEEIRTDSLGAASGRFNYELVCDIGKRVPRLYVKNGELLETK